MRKADLQLNYLKLTYLLQVVFLHFVPFSKLSSLLQSLLIVYLVFDTLVYPAIAATDITTPSEIIYTQPCFHTI